jgi:hypothetical protein
LIAGIGSASAGDDFAILDGISAVEMQPLALDAVRGGNHTLVITPASLVPGQTATPAAQHTALDGLGMAKLNTYELGNLLGESVVCTTNSGGC